jgi:hypothetical protein
MPTHPLSEAQRRHKTGEWNRIQKLAHNAAGEAQYPFGRHGTYVQPRPEGGLVIGRGKKRLVIHADETSRLIELAQELAKPSSPHATTPAKARLMVYPCPGPEGARVITAHPVS